MFLPNYNMEQKVGLFFIILLSLKIIFSILVKKNYFGEKFKNIFVEILDWVNTGFSALWVAFLIMYFVVQAFKIPSGSMENTLLIGDHLLVNKFFYGIRLPNLKISNEKKLHAKNIKINDNFYINFYMKRYLTKNDIKRGDMLVFAYPNDTTKDFIKRCVAIPGDKVEIKNKLLYVNDILQEDKYAVHKDFRILDAFNTTSEHLVRDNYGPIVLEKDYYFMLGDNRDNSLDSRYWGPLYKDYIKGKPILIVFPFHRIKFLSRGK